MKNLLGGGGRIASLHFETLAEILFVKQCNETAEHYHKDKHVQNLYRSEELAMLFRFRNWIINNRKILMYACIPLSVCLLLTYVFLFANNNQNVTAASSYYRQKAVTHMNNMAGTQWQTNNNFSDLEVGSRIAYYNKYVYYKGMPYTQGSINTTYSNFMSRSAYIPVGGTSSFYLFNYNNDPIPSRYGNDCSTAVAQAWQAGGCPIANVWNGDIYTGDMLDAIQSTTGYLGMFKIGSYKAPAAQTSEYVSTPHCSFPAGITISNLYFADTTGWSVYQKEKREVYLAYLSLLPGDSLLRIDPTMSHTILITAITGTGIMYTDQIGCGSASATNEMGWRLINTGSTWTLNATLTFDQLYEKHYLPLTANMAG